MITASGFVYAYPQCTAATIKEQVEVYVSQGLFPPVDGSAVPVKTELDSAGRVSDTLPLDHPERPGHTYTGNADGVGFFDPRPFSGGTAPRVTIRELPVQRISVGFPPQDMTALNGPTRVIPKTMASHDPIPSLAEECDRRLCLLGF